MLTKCLFEEWVRVADGSPALCRELLTLFWADMLLRAILEASKEPRSGAGARARATCLPRQAGTDEGRGVARRGAGLGCVGTDSESEPGPPRRHTRRPPGGAQTADRMPQALWLRGMATRQDQDVGQSL